MINKYLSICSRVGSINPDLAAKIIKLYSKEGETILDPFSGKGTIPFLSLINNRKAVGNDLSPEAYVLTRSKIRPVNLTNAYNDIKKLEQECNNSEINSNALEEVNVFYSTETLKQIIFLRDFFTQQNLIDMENDVHFLLLSVILGLLHGNSKEHFSVKCSHSFSMSSNYVKKYSKTKGLEPPEINVFDSIKKRILGLKEETRPKKKGRAYMEDARRLNFLNDKTIDVIISSPPYLNLITYAWDNWLRLWFLGYDYKDIRKRSIETASIFRYNNQMLDVFTEMNRVLKNQGTLVFILGKLREKNSHKIIEVTKQIASESSFKLSTEWSDDIRLGKKYLTSINGFDKGISKEQILVFHKN